MLQGSAALFVENRTEKNLNSPNKSVKLVLKEPHSYEVSLSLAETLGLPLTYGTSTVNILLGNELALGI